MASFGENLRRERELRGVSLRDIADSTKISIRFFDALEKGRVDQLPGGLFPRAFVRQYAKHLGLDVEKVVADFLYEHGESGLEKIPAQSTRPRVPRGLILFLAVAAAGGVLTWKRMSAERESTRAERVAPATLAPVILPSDRVYPPPPSLGTRATPAPVAATEGLTISLTAQQSCWVQVQVDGQIVLNRVLSEGETETLEARGQIVLSVGNAGGLLFRVNNRPGIPLGKSGEVRRNIVINKDNLPSLVKEDVPADTPSHSG
jgi:cytoskeleton protein RodZ